MTVECYGCKLKMIVSDKLFGKPVYCLACSRPQYPRIKLVTPDKEKPPLIEDKDEDFAF